MDKMVNFLKITFHISILFLIIVSLFPGSLFGFLLYNDLGKQPNLIDNHFGTSINHFLYYFYVSTLGLFLYLKDNNFQKLFYSLCLLSIVLEILQFIVPSRSFEIYDVIGNVIGVLIAYLLVVIYKSWKKL